MPPAEGLSSGEADPWAGGAPAALAVAPNFRAALAAYAAGMAELYAGNRLLNALMGDRGRTVFWLLIFYLDALPREDGGGLAAGRLIQLCNNAELCSPGRTRALLALMQWGGYVAPADAAGGDRRVKPLAVQEKMYELQRKRWHLLFSALAGAAPEAARYIERLPDLAFTRRISLHLGRRYLAGYRVVHAAPALAGLIDHDCAVLLLLALYANDHAGLPPPTIAELSRRFHVSRTHVLKVLRTAGGQGLVEPPAERGTGRLSAEGRAAVEQFFAAGFCFVASCAWRALRSD